MSEDRSVRQQTVAPSARRSISSVLDDVPESELERIAIEVIRQNRRHLEHAHSLFERLEALRPGVTDETCRQLLHDYRLALITLSGHHQVVSAVIDALGYVPEVANDSEVDSGLASLN